jgi:hypothetical protein
MKTINIFTILTIFLHFTLSACGEVLPEGELTIVVTNDFDKPLSDAEAGAFFPHIYGAGSAAKGESVKGRTNHDGVAVLKGAFAGTVGGGVEAVGYYRTQFEEVDFPNMFQRGEDLQAKRNVVLKKIIKPVPLYARQLRHIKIPDFNAPFGFDLEVGDWVAPHGKGKTADMIFQINGTYKSYREHDLTLEISFPNEGDGLIEFKGSRGSGSALRSDHLAPESGYKPSLVLRRKALYEQKSSQWLNDSKPGRNYYLRTRTKLDEKGNVIRANYGKTYGNFEFLDFIKAEAYYFNPTVNDRNIEFDTKRNLANPSKSFEKVLMP